MGIKLFGSCLLYVIQYIKANWSINSTDVASMGHLGMKIKRCVYILNDMTIMAT